MFTGVMAQTSLKTGNIPVDMEVANMSICKDAMS